MLICRGRLLTMVLVLPKLLDAAALSEIESLLADGVYESGQGSAGKTAAQVKNNRQLDRAKTPRVAEADQIILNGLWQNNIFRTMVIPRKIKPPYYVKYNEGMGYGTHVDNPIMGGDMALRTDLSLTVFLSDPADYGGGELLVRTDTGNASIKLPKGDAVVYSTTALHSVNEVTRGERFVAISWVQSVIADPHKRRIAGEMDLACQSLMKKMPDSEELLMLMRTHGDLYRLWGEV